MLSEFFYSLIHETSSHMPTPDMGCTLFSPPDFKIIEIQSDFLRDKVPPGSCQ